MIYTIGGTVLDIIFKQGEVVASKSGGSSLNTAVSLARLKNKVCFISEVGDDLVGQIILKFLSENNVDVSQIIINSQRKTSIALAFLNNINAANYQFYKDLPPHVEVQNISFSKNDCFLFSSSYAFEERTQAMFLNTIESAVRQDIIRLYDPNLRRKITDDSDEKQIALKNISYASIVRASDEDCLHLFYTANSFDVYEMLKQLGVNYFIFTKSSEIVILFTPNFIVEIFPPKITTVSTIGAGDTFNAGLLHSLHSLQKTHTTLADVSKEQWISVLNFAVVCAQKVCMSIENYLE